MAGDAQPMPEEDALRFKANELAEMFELNARVMRTFPRMARHYGLRDFWTLLDEAGRLLDGEAGEGIDDFLASRVVR